jgi:hypothetical protein
MKYLILIRRLGAGIAANEKLRTINLAEDQRDDDGLK